MTLIIFTFRGPPGGRGLRPSASCCEDRPSRIHTIGLAHSHSSRTTAQAQATYQPSYTSPHMGDDLIEGRYEIYGSTKSSYSRDTTYTLLPADSVVENKLAEEFEEDNSSGEEPSAESPDTVMEGPDKAGESGTLPEDEEFEDPGYEKIMLAEEMNKKGEQEEEESTYEVVPKVAQQVMLIKQPVPETIKENEIIIESEQVEFEEINDTPCDSLEKVEEPIVIEPKLIDLSHYDTLVPRPKKETETVKRVEIEEVHKRTSVVETVKAINKRNLRAAQSLELLSNRLFTKRGEEANNNIVTREMVKAKSIDRVHQDIKDHAKIKEKRVTYHASVDTLSKKEFYRSAESAVDQAFMEEQYCYEPESKASSTKQVMRTRSLMSLEEEQGFRGLPRGKITTGPDGTFRIGGRKASSELNLSEESDQGSEGEVAKPPRLVTGEDLRRRKQEIFKERPLKQPDSEKFFKDINGGRTTKEQAIDNLKRYLKENKIGLRDLLINNNIVIIEPYREENDRDISEYSTRCMKEEKCRITGATIKNPGENNKLESNTLPRASKPYQPTVQRHFFYRCFKTNQKYVDDDLPDPDKVKYARELFQRVGKYAAPEDTILMLPIAAKMYKRDPGPRTTPEVRVVDVPIPKKPQQEQARRWTDTGSQSSGVSSDMSEEMREGFSEEEHEHEMQEVRAATFAEAQPVSPEVLKKIRACGTSVTYYGGRMIARSEGPARSPMTMTILDEIRTSHHQRRPSQDYLGVKFRLIKSNSCGSRLELAGTHTKLVRPDIFGGKSLNEELAECTRPRQMENIDDGKSVHGSWRQLIETRKQARTRAHTSTPRYSDIDFEEFQVVE